MPPLTETPPAAEKRRRQLKFEEFRGESVEAAEELARESLGDRLLGTDTVRGASEKSATGRGRTPDETLEAAEKRVPKEALGSTPAKVIQESRAGTAEVNEFTEFEARRALRSEAPRGAELDSVECTSAPKDGVLGFGKKPGTWVAKWTAPFVAEVTFQMPAIVSARFFA